jgi:hypothetical protein
MKRIGIVGSRRKNSEEDFKKCEKAFLSVYEDGDEIVSGGCYKGGDRFAEIIAKKRQIPIKIYYAAWDKLGKGAGFARNTDIARDSDILIAVVADDRTGGTEDTISKAEKMEKKIIIVGPQKMEEPDDQLNFDF